MHVVIIAAVALVAVMASIRYFQTLRGVEVLEHLFEHELIDSIKVVEYWAQFGMDPDKKTKRRELVLIRLGYGELTYASMHSKECYGSLGHWTLEPKRALKGYTAKQIERFALALKKRGDSRLTYEQTITDKKGCGGWVLEFARPHIHTYSAKVAVN